MSSALKPPHPSLSVATASAPPPVVLTIAGSDSGGGAGIQADSRAIHALGGFACTAITAITAQNTLGVRALLATPATLLSAQITAVLDDLPVAAVKTGLLPDAASVRVVARLLAAHPRLPLVVDPVIGSTSGTRFLDHEGLAALRELLLPRATLVAPNWPEAAALADVDVTDVFTANRAAEALRVATGAAILLKGGHSSEPDTCTDLLVHADGRAESFTGHRIETVNTHGTGCTLSAAIAAGLARGASLSDAVRGARDLLRAGLLAGRGLRWGAGAGPALGGDALRQ